jgi:hypothetical protein
MHPWRLLADPADPSPRVGAAVAELADEGLSQRRIADILGVHHTTVLRDQAGANAPGEDDWDEEDDDDPGSFEPDDDDEEPVAEVPWYRSAARTATRPDSAASSSWSLARTRRRLGEFAFGQEFACRFLDADNQVYATSLIQAALSPEVVPLGLPVLESRG